MTFPTVIRFDSTSGSIAATDAVCNIPAATTAGNTLLLICRKSGNTDLTFPADWTELFQGTISDNSDDVFIVGWRKADGAEGTTVTLTGTASSKFASVYYEIAGAADPTVTPPEVQNSFSSVDSTSPDPPSLTPAAGAKDYLWIIVGSWEGEQTSPPTYPANYTSNQLDQNSGTGGAVATNCQTAIATRELNTASAENPGAFTISAADAWMCCTILIHPAPPTAVLPRGPTVINQAVQRAAFW